MQKDRNRLALPLAALVVLGIGGAWAVLRARNGSAQGGYRLLRASSELAKTNSSSIPFPRLAYEIEVPPEAWGVSHEAEVVGTDQQRLPIRVSQGLYPYLRIGRSGYSVAPASPTLVVKRAGQVVLKSPLPPLPAPIRSIPLIVSLSDTSELLPAAREGSRPPHPPYRWNLAGGRPVSRNSHVMVWRTEWANFGDPYFQRYTREIAFDDPDVGRIAEVEVTETQRTLEHRDADAEIEIYKADRKAGIRVLKPVRVAFSDGATAQIGRQDVEIIVDSQGNVGRNFALSMIGTSGAAGFFLKNVSVGTGVLPQRTNTGGTLSTQVDVRSPNLGDLGVAQLSIGHRTLTWKPTRPVALGRHRLRLRFTHAIGVTKVNRQFVRMRPHEGVASG